MKTKKRFLSILLSLALVLGLMPEMSMTAYAESAIGIGTIFQIGTADLGDYYYRQSDVFSREYYLYRNFGEATISIGSNYSHPSLGKYRVIQIISSTSEYLDKEAQSMGIPVDWEKNSSYNYFKVDDYDVTPIGIMINGGSGTEKDPFTFAIVMPYIVTYNTNGGTFIMPITGVNALPSELPTTTKEGFIFVGWYTDETLVTPAVAGTAISENTTLYAKWKQPISYTVTFKVANGKWDDDSTADKTVTLTGYEGDTLKLEADQIPAVGGKPNDTFKAGSWDVEPSTETAISEATTYTYTYAEKETAVVTKAPTAKTLTYNGSAQELVSAGTSEGGTMYYAVTTENTAPTDDDLYTTSIPTATDAGTYTVYYYVKGDSNHMDTDKQKLTCTIKKAAHEDQTAESVEVQAGKTDKEIDLSAYLEDGATLIGSETDGGLDISDLALSGTTLTFTVAENGGDKDGTITLTVGSTNYEAYKIKIPVHFHAKVTEVALETAGDDAETSVSDVKAPGLDEYTKEESASQVEVKLTVKPESEETVAESIGEQKVAEIRNAVSDAFSGVSADQVEKEYLDLTITKKVGDADAVAVKDLDRVLEIAVSYDLTGKYNPVIIREHEGEISQFTRLKERPQNGNYTDGTFYTNGTDTIWIYAQYFSTYTIAYATTDSVQVTFDDGAAQTQVIVEKGGKVTKPSDPAKDGYTFTGWYKDGTAWNFDSGVTGDITLVAQWKQNEVEPPAPETPTDPAAPSTPETTTTPVTPSTPETPTTPPATDTTPTAPATPDIVPAAAGVPVRAPQTGDPLPIVWLWGLILAAGLLMSGYAGARLLKTKKSNII
ncbi:MAG: InlB B-repeat-containing protein [Lachnospiraceae bacterium]|nr:InlB B-repeat-containing protein [Lachnospiraceae bacterium]